MADTPTPPKNEPMPLGTPKELPNTMPAGLLDAALAATGAKPSEPPKDPPKANPEPKAATPAPKPAPSAKPPEARPEPAKVEPKVEPKGGDTPKSLREALERAQAKADEALASFTASTKEKADALAKVAELELKTKTYEDRISKELEPQVQKLSAMEKKLQEKEERLRIRDYMATEEYHEKYVKPIAEIQTEIGELIPELRVQTESGEIPATIEDFNKVLSAPSANEASRLAKKMFGEDISPQLVNLRLRLVSAQRRQQEGLKNAQLEAIEWEKNATAQQMRHQEETRNALMSEIKSRLESDADFKPADDDNEAIGALAEGQKFAESLLNVDPNLTQKQLLSKIADAQKSLRKFPLLEVKNRRLAAENAALKEELKQYQSTEPGVEGRGGSSGPSGTESVQDKLLKAAQDMIRR